MIEDKMIRQAVRVLREINRKYYEDCSKKKPLLADEKGSTLYLHITLKKVNYRNSMKKIKVRLPHRLLKDSHEVCLITGDLDKKHRKPEVEQNIYYYKELLKMHGVTGISEIVTLHQLGTEYKPYEARLKLLGAFDVFLTDKKLSHLLPSLLGKHFYKKRKFPIGIDMSGNLKQAVDKALSTKLFFLGNRGNSCASEVAYLDMDVTEIIDNIQAMMKVLSERLPGSWENIMGVHLKIINSREAIPLYISYDDADIDFIDERSESPEMHQMHELSTFPNMRVKVLSNGKIKTEYMEELSDDEGNEIKEETVEKNEISIAEKNQADGKSTEELQFSNDSDTLTEPVKKKKKAITKRKQTESESVMNVEVQNSNETPIQALKKKKIEGINMKQCSNKKAARKKETVEKNEISIAEENQADGKSTEELQFSNNSDTLTEPVKKKKKAITKRKQTESESVMNVEVQNSNETPIQALKKKKIEGINMKQCSNKKAARKNKKKENQQKHEVQFYR